LDFDILLQILFYHNGIHFSLPGQNKITYKLDWKHYQNRWNSNFTIPRNTQIKAKWYKQVEVKIDQNEDIDVISSAFIDIWEKTQNIINEDLYKEITMSEIEKVIFSQNNS
jgi:hypothetical protein